MLLQVALKLLHCWERIAINNSEVIRPYIPALLPPVVCFGSQAA
jgi:hypothetical protein